MASKKIVVSKGYSIVNFENELSFFCNFLHKKKIKDLTTNKFDNKNTIFSNRLTTPTNESDAINIKEELNAALAKWLNHFHKLSYHEEQWALILYPFISIYVDHIYVIYERIKFLIEKFQIHEIIVDEVSYNYQHTPKNIDEFISTLANIDFNNFIFSQLISNIPDFEDEKNKIIIYEKPELFIEKPHNTNLYVGKNFKSTIRIFFHKIFEFLPYRAKQPLIIGSFLPYYEDFKFKVLNFSSPKICNAPDYEKSNADPTIRESINLDIGKNSLDNFIYNNIKHFLPTAYIEDFGKISRLMHEQKWPKLPKYIFTSNNYFWDEPFKVWAASKASMGVPIIIGQHGNHFGTNTKYRNCPEERISSKFITWGWRRGSKHIPFAILKTIGRRRFGKSYGGLLFIISTNDNRTSPISFIMNTHFDRLISASKTMDLLDVNVKKLTQIRFLHKNLTSNGGESTFFSTYNPDIIIEYGETPFVASIRHKRLVVFCYDSTGMLECISMNKPCACLILEEDLLNLEPEAFILYEELIEVGIYYTDPCKLSLFINENWDKINEWWCDKSRQAVLRKFSGNYANNVSFPLFKLHRILNDVAI